ncbi:MAG TPA: phosphoglycolate phosphatase [Usitatibacter sp.]|nr:phosphoglycolate phosphatase [Usitatibacter sp.]
MIFDLDGTLIDSAGEIADALARTFESLGLQPMPRPLVEKLIGRGVRVLVERALVHAKAGPIDVDAAVARFESHYADTVGTGATLFPGVSHGLGLIGAQGLPMAVVTNKPRYFTLQLLERLGIAHDFDAVIAGDDGFAKKPAPDMLAAAAKALGVPVAEVLMIGDSGNDTVAARAAGCPVWCVRHGYNEGQPPEALDCDRLLDGVDEVARALTAGDV